LDLKYLFDTNIFIAQIVNDPKAVEFFSPSFISQNEIITSQIVRMELLSYPSITLQAETIIKLLLDEFEVILIDDDIESEAINLRRNFKIKLPDAIIAATSIVEKAELVTFNTKDFSKIKELKLYK